MQGAERIAAGPRAIQGILQKLQLRIEEQRLNALLQEQQDAPVDVQVAFQLYEDAPQDLRSRLWIAVLEHPELCNEYQVSACTLLLRWQLLPLTGPQQQRLPRSSSSGATLPQSCLSGCLVPAHRMCLSCLILASALSAWTAAQNLHAVACCKA